MRSQDKLFWIWLSEALGAASRDFQSLIELYQSPYDIFLAEDAELERISGISEATRSSLADKSLQRATKILDTCEKLDIGILTYADEAYPAALREIKKPPILLYYSGTVPAFDTTLCIGMVGTRRMSEYGLKAAYKISYELAQAGAVVVSGMAAGIDGVCAAAALAAKGVTVAVLGCGLDVVYPQHHKILMEEIRRHGLLLSEYPPGTRPNRYHFPTRNRLISGLSQGTVVVEAGVGSGSLITAKEAILQGRDVFALPSNLGRQNSEGTNGLLRDGANLVTGVADILKPYQYIYAETLRTERLSKVDPEFRVDLQYLARLGVIQIEAQTVEANAARVSVTKEAQRQPRRRAAGKEPSSPKGEKAATATSTTLTEEKPISVPKQTPDEVLSSLTPVQRAVLEAIPDDRAITADSLGGLGYPYGDTIAALTMLEILGLIQKLPGALYTKS